MLIKILVAKYKLAFGSIKATNVEILSFSVWYCQLLFNTSELKQFTLWIYVSYRARIAKTRDESVTRQMSDITASHFIPSSAVLWTELTFKYVQNIHKQDIKLNVRFPSVNVWHLNSLSLHYL